MAQILIIDDHDSVREELELLLRRRGHRTLSAEGGQRGLDLLEEEGADLVITDLRMAHLDGMEVLKRVRERAPATDVLVITAYGTMETAVEAMKLGAADFITKPISSEEFGVKIERILRERAERERLRKENVALRVENAWLKEDVQVRYGEIVGESQAMQDVFGWIERVARSNSTAMIYGESGTGKELVARAIHAASSRREGPFIRVNCGALAEGLLDSELFSHEKGAFTGAERRRRGRFELAHGGTLFLDEIATISPTTQVRLLRVLQERELERVGGEETIPVDVRIIAATNTTAETLLAAIRERRIGRCGPVAVLGERRQIGHLEQLALGHHERALDHVFQLVHVAGPVVLHQATERALAHGAHRRAGPVAQLVDEVPHQHRDVGPAIAQGWNRERHDL